MPLSGGAQGPVPGERPEGLFGASLALLPGRSWCEGSSELSRLSFRVSPGPARPPEPSRIRGSSEPWPGTRLYRGSPRRSLLGGSNVDSLNGPSPGALLGEPRRGGSGRAPPGLAPRSPSSRFSPRSGLGRCSQELLSGWRLLGVPTMGRAPGLGPWSLLGGFSGGLPPGCSPASSSSEELPGLQPLEVFLEALSPERTFRNLPRAAAPWAPLR